MLLAEADHHCQARDAIDDPHMVAAYLWYDGYVALPAQTTYVPINEPLYTQGRPEREAFPGGTSDCIPAGGIPILSDRLYRFLESLGAEGTLGKIIYRGFSKKAYDTVQPGYHRFLPNPIYTATHDGKLIAELPLELPALFAIQTSVHVKSPKPAIETMYHIGLSPESLHDLAQILPRVLIAPLRRREPHVGSGKRNSPSGRGS